MNTIAWIVINAVLLGSAVASVKLAKDLPKELKEEQKQLLSQEKPNAKKAAKEATKDAKAPKAAAKPAQTEQKAPQIRMGTLDDIWKKSLFNPDRTELTETEAPQDSEPIQTTNAELELGGIAQLGKSPVAIIRTKPQQRGRGGRPGMGGNMQGGRFGQPGGMQGNRFQPGNMPGMMGNRFQPGNMPGMMGGRFGQNGMPLPPWMQQQQQQQQAQPQGKKIFRIGDTIHDTGYVLKDIIPEERACIISRNGRDEKLSIEFGDAQSSSRKQDAVNYQKEVIAKAEAAARQNQNQNNQNQNRWQDRRRMMMGGGNMPGGMMRPGMGGFGGMPGGGMMPGGFNRFGNNGMNNNQQGGFNRGGFGGSSGGGFNRGGFGG
ncbi:MAG: hypothetical protein IKZ46_00175, partial [Victivallales bacterium]|nr:hypothetical protein [Victivallales bacterium]